MLKRELATFGGGCFWCVEAVFQEVEGVHKVESGYSGGNSMEVPTYELICTGKSGYAEVIQMEFDPEVIAFADLVRIFLTTHDPTQLNRQGADRGTQYRSIILYHDAEQKAVTEQVIHELQPYFDQPIVTEVSAFNTFYKAESEHQDFYRNHSYYPYCQIVISPKLRKLRELHREKLKR